MQIAMGEGAVILRPNQRITYWKANGMEMSLSLFVQVDVLKLHIVNLKRTKKQIVISKDSKHFDAWAGHTLGNKNSYKLSKEISFNTGEQVKIDIDANEENICKPSRSSFLTGPSTNHWSNIILSNSCLIYLTITVYRWQGL